MSEDKNVDKGFGQSMNDQAPVDDVGGRGRVVPDRSSESAHSVKGVVSDKIIGSSETAQQTAQTVRNVKNVAGVVKTTVSGFVALVTNPVTWIVLLVVLVLGGVTTGIVAGVQTLGRNENADGCYGIGGGSASTIVVDEGSDWTGRANSMGSWLMSNNFDFLGGKAMSKKQTAALMGNFIAESGVTFAQAQLKGENSNGQLNKMSNDKAESWTRSGTSIRDDRGLGLVQWTWNPGRAGDLIDLARGMGKNWYDADVQLALLKSELDTSYGSRLLAAGFNDDSKSVEELVKIFHDIYEGSADKNMNKRNQAANDFLGVFTGGTSGNTGGSCILGSASVDTSSVVGLAISTAYTSKAEARVTPGDSYGTTRAKPEYKEAKAQAMAISKEFMPTLYASCDRYVATVIINTVDPELPWGSTANQGEYLLNSPKWEQYTRKSQAQPGDIWITKTRGHVILYIGDYNGVDSIAHASYLDFVGTIDNAIYLNENMVDYGGRPYYGYRFVG